MRSGHGCMGPSHDDKKSNSIAEELLLILRQKWGILADEVDMGSPEITNNFKKMREERILLFKKAVDELICQDEWENW